MKAQGGTGVEDPWVALSLLLHSLRQRALENRGLVCLPGWKDLRDLLQIWQAQLMSACSRQFLNPCVPPQETASFSVPPTLFKPYAIVSWNPPVLAQRLLILKCCKHLPPIFNAQDAPHSPRSAHAENPDSACPSLLTKSAQQRGRD